MISREPSPSYYSVLGVEPRASAAEVRSAYRKLAIKWHPDKFTAGSSDKIDFAKRKFQEIQEAYNVLSDEGKRALYDSQLYDPTGDDEEVQGLGSFVKEMSILMAQVKREGGSESFEELQDLFIQMFRKDLEMWNLSPVSTKGCHHEDGHEWRHCTVMPSWEDSIHQRKASSRKRGRTKSFSLKGEPVEKLAHSTACAYTLLSKEE